jgi:hypothetical protein
LAGFVGGLRSRAAKAGEVPKSDTSTTRIAATLAVRQKGMYLFILCLLTDKKFEAAARLLAHIYVLNVWLDLVDLELAGEQMFTGVCSCDWGNGNNILRAPIDFSTYKSLNEKIRFRSLLVTLVAVEGV